MTYTDFTSLPPEEERAFVVYEQTSRESGKKAMTLGAIVGILVGLFGVILYFAVEPPPSVHAVAPSELGEEAKTVISTPPQPEPEEPAPAAELGAEEEAAPDEAADGEEGAAAEEGAGAAAEAPAPPKGATKAPPTDLIKKK